MIGKPCITSMRYVLLLLLLIIVVVVIGVMGVFSCYRYGNRETWFEGHTAHNGWAQQTPSQDTSFLSNYAGNAGSQVHLKYPRNTDHAKKAPLAHTQIHSPPQSDACTFPIRCISSAFSLHLQEHIELHRPVVWLENTSAICFFSLTYCLWNHSIQDMQATSFLNRCLIFRGLDINTPLSMDMWAVSSFGLFETYGTVVKSRGFGITQTWIRILNQLCDFRGIPQPLWTLDSLSVKWESQRTNV